MKNLLIIRTDGSPRIGAGHVMRCAAIARQAMKIGADALFVVSDDVSRERVKRQGFDACIIEGNALAFNGKDGFALAALACDRSASAILVDSYGVTDDFFKALARGLRESRVRIAYMDDAYTFEYGILDHPHAWLADMVINYTFGFSASDYDAIYGISVECLVGPQFAPIRSEFLLDERCEINGLVQRVLVTTGSTNPDGILERFVDVLTGVLPDARLDVVVGSQAAYTGKASMNINILHDVKDMASLMRSCDMAVSAAGSTLYELCAVGTPSIAVPIVQNQIKNVRGYVQHEVGLGLTEIGWDNAGLAEAVNQLSSSEELRAKLSFKALSLVDGLGAERVAKRLLGV